MNGPVASAVFAGFVVVLSVGSSGITREVEACSSGGELELSEETRSVGGRFSRGVSTVEFRADRSLDGRVAAEVRVGSLLFELAYDSEAETLHFDGHDGSVSAEGRQALTALSVLLEKRWEPYTAPIPAEKHLVFRAILLLSEAPVGHVLEERTIQAGPLPPNVRPGLEQDRR